MRALSRRLREPLDSAERGALLETLVFHVYLGDVALQDDPVRVLPLQAFLQELAAGRMLAPGKAAPRGRRRSPV